MSVENLSLNENSAYVGASVTFRGDLIASDTVIVEGTVEGNVTADSVFVGTNGAIKGSLSAADAEIKGLLSESAVIKGFLHLRSTGRVAGKISCGDLEVERGAVIDGAFTVGNSPEPHAAAGGRLRAPLPKRCRRSRLASRRQTAPTGRPQPPSSVSSADSGGAIERSRIRDRSRQLRSQRRGVWQTSQRHRHDSGMTSSTVLKRRSRCP
jgi:cytoskeletal protein CcmA (bactofilin family)